ncbi:MAG TPA: hypothetical protein VKW77_06375 [Acidimicrobiales bacterium]|nr:hypothetical protein [Acidimicrobiales bacterium]
MTVIRPAGASDAGTLAGLHLATVVVAYAGLFPAAAPPPRPSVSGDPPGLRPGSGVSSP